MALATFFHTVRATASASMTCRATFKIVLVVLPVMPLSTVVTRLFPLGFHEAGSAGCDIRAGIFILPMMPIFHVFFVGKLLFSASLLVVSCILDQSTAMGRTKILFEMKMSGNGSGSPLLYQVGAIFIGYKGCKDSPHKDVFRD